MKKTSLPVHDTIRCLIARAHVDNMRISSIALGIDVWREFVRELNYTPLGEVYITTCAGPCRVDLQL